MFIAVPPASVLAIKGGQHGARGGYGGRSVMQAQSDDAAQKFHRERGRGSWQPDAIGRRNPIASANAAA
jgi:hypothetical protein